MSYLVDLSNFEVVELLKQGSTNQRNFTYDTDYGFLCLPYGEESKGVHIYET